MGYIIFFMLVVLVGIMFYWYCNFVGDCKRDKFYNSVYGEYESMDIKLLERKKVWFLVDFENKSECIFFFKMILVGEMYLFVPEIGNMISGVEVFTLLSSVVSVEMIVSIPIVDRILLVLLTALIVWVAKQIISIENGLRSKIIDIIISEKRQ